MSPVIADAIRPQRVSISSKRQITIPSRLYKKWGFTDCALCKETDEGLLLQPLESLTSDGSSVELLRYLVEEGYSGQELIERFQIMQPGFTSFVKKIDNAEEDIAEGRSGAAYDLQARMRAKYGL